MDKYTLDSVTRRLVDSEHTKVIKKCEEAADKVYASLTATQKEFVDDTAKQSTILATRRTGKTFTARSKLMINALKNPDSTCIYINTTAKECKNIMWKKKQGLLNSLTKLEVVDKATATDLTIRLINGSEIRLYGVNDTGQQEKLRGDFFDLIVVDEAAKIVGLEYFWTDVLSPALGDTDGTIHLIGTPSRVCAGYFYDLTKRGSTSMGWKRYKWTYHQNTAMPHLVEVFERRKRENGWADDDPTWLREYCAEWVQTTETLVYSLAKVPEEKRYWIHDVYSGDIVPKEHLPKRADGEDYDWQFFAGCDLGYIDAFAYSVFACTPDHPVAYEIESWSMSRLNSDEQYDILDGIRHKYNIERFIADAGVNLQTVKAWEQRGLPIEPANKRDKMGFIALANGAIERGNIKFIKNSPLPEEALLLQWDERTLNTPRPREKSSMPNHVADSFLYLFKYLNNWLWQDANDEVFTVPRREAESDFRRQKMREKAFSRDEQQERLHSYYELYRDH